MVINPHHPRRHSITPLTKEELEKTAYHFLAAQVQLGRIVTTPMSVEYLQQNFYIAALYAFCFFKRNDTQMKGSTGWTVEFAKQLGCPILGFDLIDIIKRFIAWEVDTFPSCTRRVQSWEPAQPMDTLDGKRFLPDCLNGP